MTRRLTLAIAVAFASASGCIEPVQPVLPYDVSIAPDTDAGPIGGPCERRQDCRGALPECERWECVDNVCVTSGLDGIPCDEQNLCTTGSCRAGACVTAPRKCGSSDACLAPVCRPDVGCDLEPFVGGYCEGPGPTWGECAGPLMYPVDRCDAAGTCQAIAAGGTPAPPFGAMNGDWLVFRHGLGGAGATSAAARVSLGLAGQDATATYAPLVENGVDVEPLQIGAGSWCMAPDRGFQANFPGVGAWVGQLDMTGDAFGAYAFEGNEVLVGLRPLGDSRVVDGDYRVLMVHSNPRDPLSVWLGTARFTAGCLASVARFQGDAGSGTREFRAGQCLEAGRSLGPAGTVIGRWTAMIEGEAPEMMHFEAAVSREGELLVGAWKDHGVGAEVGYIVAVREERATVGAESSWFAAFHESRPGPVGAASPVVSGRRAVLAVSGNRIAGGLGTAGNFVANGAAPPPVAFNVLDGAFRLVTRDGRVDLSPRTADRERIWSGALNSRGRLGFFFEVEPWTAGGDEVVRPSWPSFGVIVERPMPPPP